MITPVQWHWDAASIHEAIDTIERALPTAFDRIRYRKKLEDQRDLLRDTCEEFERSGLAEDCGDAYLCLFDALSHLTEAVRGRAVHTLSLERAQTALERFFDCEVTT